jgi:type I restriction enzyme M protein
LSQAVDEGYAIETTVRSRRRVAFIAADFSEYLDDPARVERAEFWAELILRYGYSPDRIRFDVPVPGRKKKSKADLVLFADGEQPFAVIECKPGDISEAEFAQAVEQVADNGVWDGKRVSYIGVVAGTSRRILDFSPKYDALEREDNVVADFPYEYGLPAEFKYRKGSDRDIAPVSQNTLLTVLRRAHQTLWGGGRLSPPTAFGELCKLIFVKITDERKRRKKGDPYDFQIRSHEAPTQLALRIRALYRESQALDPTVFSDDIKVPDGSLRSIVSQLESIDLSRTDLDVKGLAFETFMDSFFKGDFGQYFTPRKIVEFILNLMEPMESDLILDPACGSGGFLLQALEYFRLENPSESQSDVGHWRNFAEKKLFGIEINDEITRVAKMNMVLHDDGHSNIVGGDALSNFGHLAALNARIRPEAFDLVITNPPFGAQILASERGYLSGYELAHSEKVSGDARLRRGQKTEVLFIERIWQFLKPGGRMAVVLPDGILTNRSLQYVRDFMVDRFRLLAIVSLPGTAFTHYGAGVKASIVFAERRQEAEEPDQGERIFMAEADSVGYDSAGRDADNQLPEILESYRRFVKDPSKFTQ